MRPMLAAALLASAPFSLSGVLECGGESLAVRLSGNIELGDGPPSPPILPPSLPPRLGQCWEPWGRERYSSSGGATFCSAGCLVVSWASLANFAGYDLEPPEFAARIDEAGAFSGNYLRHASAVSGAFPRMIWHRGPYFSSPLYGRKESSAINWESRAADVGLLASLLESYPVAIWVDFHPATAPLDYHFVLALKYLPDPHGGINDDLLIMDPAVGGYTSILSYFNPAWLGEKALRSGRTTKVGRTVMGALIMEIESGSAGEEK